MVLARRQSLLLTLGFALAAALALAALPAGLANVSAAPAVPTTYNVDRMDDVLFAACTGAANDCSLRGAIANANVNPGSTVVLQFNGHYTLTNVPLQDLILSANMTLTVGSGICGTPPCYTMILGGAGWAFRLLTVNPGANVRINGITFQNGNGSAAGTGGGIHNEGNLMLLNSRVMSNTATALANYGGGIYNTGMLVLDNSQVGNNSGYVGGGIANNGGNLTVRIVHGLADEPDR